MSSLAESAQLRPDCCQFADPVQIIAHSTKTVCCAVCWVQCIVVILSQLKRQLKCKVLLSTPNQYITVDLCCGYCSSDCAGLPSCWLDSFCRFLFALRSVVFGVLYDNILSVLKQQHQKYQASLHQINTVLLIFVVADVPVIDSPR